MRLAGSLAALALILAAPTLAAANEPIAGYVGPGRVRANPTGTITFGVVLEVVPGEYVRMRLANGLERTFLWDEIDLVQVKGRPALGSAVPAPDPRPWVERTQGTAPRVLVSFPSDRSTAAPRFPKDGVWAVALRGTVLSPTVRGGHLGLGLGGEANLLKLLSPGFAVYGLVEQVRFSPSHLGSDEARTFMLGGGFRVGGDAREPVSALLDVATGWRVLSTTKHGHRGAIPLRLGAGLAFAPWSHLRFDALVHLAPHVFGYAASCATCARASQPYGFVGVSLAIHADV